MDNKRILSRRLVLLVLGMLIWLAIWNSLFAFVTDQILIAAIGGIVGLVLIGVAVEGSLPRRFQGREMPNLSLIILVLIILVLVYGEIQDLTINSIEEQGEFYLPGLVALIRIVGSIILAALLTWETVNLLRQPSQ